MPALPYSPDRTGDAATLERLGLDYTELRNLGDQFEVLRRIVDMACGTPKRANHSKLPHSMVKRYPPTDSRAAIVAISSRTGRHHWRLLANRMKQRARG